MSDTSTVYAVNAPRMIHETIDKDTIAIDTTTGTYFNIGGSGHVLFEMMATGATIDGMTTQLASLYAVDATTVQPLVENYIAQLLAEELVVAGPGPAPDAAVVKVDGGAPFAPPTLDKFTDMADLLLVDPIHEVEARGWPYRA